jgi:cysteine desulfurase
MKTIYLDHNSTTWIDPEVSAAMAECFAARMANPSSQHRLGQIARSRLEFLRTDILQMLGARTRGMQADQLIFTSGGTESNNLALIGMALDTLGGIPPLNRILVSAIEHPSVLEPARQLASRGFSVETIRVNSQGQVDLLDLERRLQQPARLVSVMAANHETGVLQPIQEIASLCHRYSVPVHTDAVQAVGKIPLDFSRWDVDAMSFTAHKILGPRGIGGLVLKAGFRPFPLLFGGFQQTGIRPGTEDVCLPTGLWKSLQRCLESSQSRIDHMGRLRDNMQSRLTSQCECVVNGANVDRLPNTLNIAFVGVNRQEMLLAADLEGVAVSTGSACASGSSERSPVLVAMGLPDNVIDSSIRISLSPLTTEDEASLAVDRLIEIVHRLRAARAQNQ